MVVMRTHIAGKHPSDANGTFGVGETAGHCELNLCLLPEHGFVTYVSFAARRSKKTLHTCTSWHA